MRQDPIRVAFPKDDRSAAALFRNAGYRVPNDVDESRNYIVPIEGENLTFILAKPIDIPTYVEYGVADTGIAGKEVLLEAGRKVCELLDLHINEAFAALIMKRGQRPDLPRVATRYPNVASAYFRKLEQPVDIVNWHGGMELALRTGMTDGILDVVEGTWPSDSVDVTPILRVSSQLIANRVSYARQNERIDSICERLRYCQS